MAFCVAKIHSFFEIHKIKIAICVGMIFIISVFYCLFFAQATYAHAITDGCGRFNLPGLRIVPKSNFASIMLIYLINYC